MLHKICSRVDLGRVTWASNGIRPAPAPIPERGVRLRVTKCSSNDCTGTDDRDFNCRRPWLTQILASDYAKLVARKKSARRALFPQIVSLHTKRDPGAINGLGPVSIRKIVVWLAQLDTRLRYSNASIDTVICRFTEHEVQEEVPTTFFSIMEATSSSVKPASCRIARECSPSRGGMRWISAGVSEKRAEGRACLILPSLG